MRHHSKLFTAALALLVTPLFGVQDSAQCDFTAAPPRGAQIVGNLPFTGDTVGNVLVFGYEPNQNKGVSVWS